MNYLETKNNIINSLRPLLIESFVDFYGENYRYKISNLINNVTVISVAKNESYDIINNKLENLIKKKETLGISYYQKLKNKKENDDDYYVFMTSTDDKSLEYYQQQVKTKKVRCAGWTIPEQDKPILFMVGIKTSITTLIHEINHLLTEEVLGEIPDDNKTNKKVRTHGIHNKGFPKDLVYEIINEIITQKVFESFKNKQLNNVPLEYQELITYQTSNKYLTLDTCSLDIVKDIYKRMEPVIKTSLINGNGSTIQKIIGEFNYDELRMFLLENKRGLDRFMETNKDKTPSDYIKTLSNKTISEYKRIKENIDKSYNEYLEYMISLNDYVNKLIQDNKGKRIS